MATSPSLFPQLQEMSNEQKHKLIARFMPCDLCLVYHVDQSQDLQRRLKIALRLAELLEEKGKFDDDTYEDEDIISLKKQILYNASRNTDQDLKRSRESMSDEEVEHMAKRNKLSEVNHNMKDSDGRREEDSDDQLVKIKEELDDEFETPKQKEEEELLKQEALYRNSSFASNPKLQEFLPKIRKESAAMREEREGRIRVEAVLNDGARNSMILLTGLKNLFQKQLPNMPKDYIARLVYDRNHCSIALIRNPNKVIGGICYRPFNTQEFAEIVFCAIASTEQVKGYGSFIMNHLKDHVTYHSNVKHFLTYADNFAVGYFRKQGFTTEITLDKRKWVGYIKDYEGSTIMQCSIVPQVKYLELYEILSIQRNAILKKIKEKSTEHVVFPGIKNIPNGTTIDPLQVPGISDSGWTPEMDMISNRPRHVPQYHEMLYLVEEMQNYTHAWPFLEPVKSDEVTDYYEIIKEPMDLTTLEENVKADAYPTMEDFIKDTQKIFDNCKTYNAEDTDYSKCAVKLERFFNEKLRTVNKN
ncbi:hypothetical protein G6F43_003486 [Rhizopus delemar]|nr:hypothetical protein G6F43_003486 [Rhizopus delemar]